MYNRSERMWMDEGPRNNYTLLDILTTSSSSSCTSSLFLFHDLKKEKKKSQRNKAEEKSNFNYITYVTMMCCAVCVYMCEFFRSLKPLPLLLAKAWWENGWTIMRENRAQNVNYYYEWNFIDFIWKERKAWDS